MRILIPLLFISFIFSCSVDEPNGETEPCAAVTGLKVIQSGSDIIFEWNAHPDAVDYEIAYSKSTDSKSPDDAEKFTVINANSAQKSLTEFYLETEYYDFYVRAKCGDGNGEWSAQSRLEVKDICYATQNVEMVKIYFYGPYLAWDQGNNLPPVKYEVNYGISGFTAGSGTSYITNNTTTEDLVMKGGNTYDFYVREMCQGTNEWGAWSKPYSYFSEKDNYTCRPVSGFKYEIIEDYWQAVLLRLSWENYGHIKFDYAVPEKNYLPRSYNTYTVDIKENEGWPEIELEKNDYDVYIRTYCLDGTTTDWAGPFTMEAY